MNVTQNICSTFKIKIKFNGFGLIKFEICFEYVFK
jgi:hypothetical protein